MRNRIITKMALKIYNKLPEDIRTKISRDKFIDGYLQDKLFLPLLIITYILSAMSAIMISVITFLVLGLIVPNTVFLVLAYILGFGAGPFTEYCYIKVHVKSVVDSHKSIRDCVKM